MVPLASLWLPILLAAALVWVAGSIMWMVMPHHRSDFKALPDEEAARQALRPGPRRASMSSPTWPPEMP